MTYARTTVITASLAAVLVVSMTLTPAFATSTGHPAYLDFEELNVDSKSNNSSNNENTRIKVDFSVQEDIPLDGSGGAFGYAVFTGGGVNNVLVLVTHLGLDDSEHEDETSGFHTHVLDLMTPSSHCAGAAAEVDLAGSAANKGFDLDASWSIDGDDVSIGYTPIKLLNDTANVDAVVAFTVEPVENEGLHLCVITHGGITP